MVVYAGSGDGPGRECQPGIATLAGSEHWSIPGAGVFCEIYGIAVYPISPCHPRVVYLTQYTKSLKRDGIQTTISDRQNSVDGLPKGHLWLKQESIAPNRPFSATSCTECLNMYLKQAHEKQ
jgi:hypothetical protein